MGEKTEVTDNEYIRDGCILRFIYPSDIGSHLTCKPQDLEPIRLKLGKRTYVAHGIQRNDFQFLPSDVTDRMSKEHATLKLMRSENGSKYLEIEDRSMNGVYVLSGEAPAQHEAVRELASRSFQEIKKSSKTLHNGDIVGLVMKRPDFQKLLFRLPGVHAALE